MPHEIHSTYAEEIVRFSRAGNGWWNGAPVLNIQSKADELGNRKTCTIHLTSEEAIDSLINVVERCRASLRAGKPVN